MWMLLLGVFLVFGGLAFLVGCFLRVDSGVFLDRAAGDHAKVAKLRSLQASWDKIGKVRQFLASSLGFLLFGTALLVFSYDASLWRYFWVPVVFLVVHFFVLRRLGGEVKTLLSSGSQGDTEVHKVFGQSMRTCIIAIVILVVFGVRASGEGILSQMYPF